MALPALHNVYCADFQSGSDWYSPVGDFERINQPYGCGRGWVIVHSSDWQVLLQAADGSQLDFYADSTALFYLAMVAIVAVWAFKSVVQKLFYAS